MEGFGSSQGVKSAQLSCSGGTITASAHPAILANFTGSFSGVQWSNDGDCGKQRQECLLTLCGNTPVLFPSAVVRNVNTSDTAGMLLCFVGNNNLSFEAAQFEGNAIRPITVLSPNVSLHVKNTTFKANQLPERVFSPSLSGGALLIDGGTARVESSNLSGNSVDSSGGAITVMNSARLHLVATVLSGNKGA
jgi:hypothetical protein